MGKKQIMNSSDSKIVRATSKAILRHGVWIACIGTALAFVGGYFTFLLYKNLRTNIEELLPTSARSVGDLTRLGNQVKSVENLVVLIFSADPAASKRFVIDLAEKLNGLPKRLVAGVEYRIDGEIQFFRKRRVLFLEVENLKKLTTFIRAQALYQQDKLGLNLGLIPEPKFDLESLRRKYTSDKTSFLDRFPDGFYASADQTKRALIVDLPGRAADIDAALNLKSAVEKTIAELDPKHYSPDLEVRYTGNTENLIEEHAALIADLKFSTIVVILLVSAAMLFFYRDFWATSALVTSVLVGTLWTMGWAYFLTGYLNANSAFLASIVIGNGINFGIIFLARYLEERRRQRRHYRALLLSIKATYKPTLLAALAAGISYGSLMLTSFRGFNQFGVIGLCGMILCWISSYLVLPGYLTLIDRWRKRMRADAMASTMQIEGLARLVRRYPRTIVALSLLITIGAILAPFFHRSQFLELDMNKLRDRASMRSGSGFYYHYIAEIFGKNLSPMVLLTDSRENARRIAAALRMKKAKEGALSQIAWVQTLDDIIPVDQENKIALIKGIRSILAPSLLRRLLPEQRELASELAASSNVEPFGEDDLPPLIIDRFTQTDGTRGRIILVDKPVVEAGQEENALVTVSFIRELRSIVDAISPETAIVGQLPITADMISAILQDGPRATLFAWGAVFLLIVILFRNFRMIALVSFTLWIGIIWFAGLILGLGLKINFLNFIALPITFGIGVDYGVNIFQRYREDGMLSIVDTVRHTGAAVMLCSLTTVIGYASLILASNRAFVSFGTLAILGEICCVAVAVVLLPAFLLTRGPLTFLRSSLRAQSHSA